MPKPDYGRQPEPPPVRTPTLPPDFPDIPQNRSSELQPAPDPSATPDKVAGTAGAPPETEKSGEHVKDSHEPNDTFKAALWRLRAEEMRAIAEGTTDTNARATMLRISADYVRLAGLADQRSALGVKFEATGRPSELNAAQRHQDGGSPQAPRWCPH
jgi:hypothetical protein